MSAPRHAVVLATGRLLEPFGDPIGETQVLARTLAEVQREAIAAAGLELVEAPPPGAPYVLISDRTWVTEGALKRLMAQAQAPARLQCTDETWLEMTGALQDWPARGVYEVALLPAGAPPSFEGVPPVVVDLEFEASAPPEVHPAMAHAFPERIVVSDACVHQIDHWMHALRVNWYAISATVKREERRVRGLYVLVWLMRVLWLLLRVRSLNMYRLAAGLTRVGKRCRIHPTAVVEASVLGDDVEIGPFAVVRAAVIGDGVKIEEHGVVNLSVLGDGSKIGRKGTANMCLLYPGAFIALGNGYQASVFGRDSFVAWSVTAFDLSFKDPIKVLHRGARVSSDTHFLGVCVGHRAKVGAHCALGYGSELPNDSFLVGGSSEVMRRFEPGPAPHRVRDGVATSIHPSACGGQPAGLSAEGQRSEP
ncbi:MAG: hypothetical protein H6741_11020 [Alphaproteobacteria bacterium]|nr:hypothetical protein [Alphaproteobacteria bacterium]